MNVLLVAAMTADGYIGQHKDHLATSWTNPEDKTVFNEIVQTAGNMVMGLNTFRTTASKYPGVFNKTMPDRRLLVYTEDPADVANYKNVEAVAESPVELISRLEREGVKSLAVCGGTQIYTMFMAAGVVDELFVDMQATVFGTGVPLLNSSVECKLKLADVRRLGDDNVLLHYKVLR